MDDLVKKFYWLIITTLVSLIILLITSCVKEVSHFQFYNPFHSKYKEWENLEDSLLTFQRARYESHQKIHDYIVAQKRFDKLFFRDCDNVASLADLRINLDISIIDALIDSKKSQGLMFNETDRLVKWQKTLNEELGFWNFIGENSFNFMNDSTHFDARRFKFDYNLIRHKYIASYNTYFLYLGLNFHYWNPFLGIGKFLLKLYIYWLSILGIGYLMFEVLLPFGSEIWKEKTKNKSNKKR